MDISPAFGKILGMLMAYIVSALGLLLAYYNYRKRIIKAEQVFSPVAKGVITGVVCLMVVGSVVIATVASSDASSWVQAFRQHLPGLVLPAFIVLVSVWLTWLLYRHFARQLSGDEAPAAASTPVPVDRAHDRDP